ncbi:MAG: zinc ribbon domain-containing protein [Acidobacteria bacterium]|nr:zinc ribbon domain-containing protein [Acidobacteriota bacterium]
MPIYEYECRKCHTRSEAMQKINDKPLTKCSKCGGRLEKQWSPTSFQLKGSGWYVTDYAGKKSDAKEEKASAKEEKTAPAPSKTESKSETTSSEKPAAKNRKRASKSTPSNTGD